MNVKIGWSEKGSKGKEWTLEVASGEALDELIAALHAEADGLPAGEKAAVLEVWTGGRPVLYRQVRSVAAALAALVKEIARRVGEAMPGAPGDDAGGRDAAAGEHKNADKKAAGKQSAGKK